MRLGGRKAKDPSSQPDAGKEKSHVVRFPFTGTPIPAGGTLLDRYPLTNPYAYAAIIEDESGGRRYYLDEVPLTAGEARVYSYILDKLETELTIPRAEVDPKRYFAEQAQRIVKKYGIKVAPLPWAKILYFAERDLVGFGVLDAMLKDPNIEDISVDGVGKPIFIYHRRFESLGTNLVFGKDPELDSLITRLAHMAGKHISTAFPILQGTLPGRHRLLATFRREISPYGSTLCMKSGHVQLSDGVAEDIRDLFEESKAKWGSRTDAGNEVVDVDGRIAAVGVNEKTLGFSEVAIKQVIRLPPPRSLTKVWVKEGEKSSEPFEVTRNHRFHTIGRDGIEIVEASELKPGAWIPVPVKIPLENVKLSQDDFESDVLSALKSSEHDLLVSLEGDALALAEQAVVNLGGVHNAERALRLRWGYLFDALARLRNRHRRNAMKLRTFLELLAAAGVQPSMSELHLSKRGAKIRVPLKLTEDLAFLIGWVLADGLVYPDRIKVTPADPTDRDAIAAAFRREFGVDCHMYNSNSKCFDMIYTSSAIADFFHLVFGIPKSPKSRRIRVPRVIMRSDNRVVSAFLRGLFQGDGTYRRPRVVSLKSFSKMMLRDVQFLLTRFGIMSFATSDHRLGIPVSYQGAFFNEVMCLEKEVRQEVGRIGKIAPTPFVESLVNGARSRTTLEALRRETKVDFRTAGARRAYKQNITFDRARRAVQALGINAGKDWLFNLIEKGYDFKQVSRVEEVPNSECVYDVVCEPDHWYIGGVVPSVVYDTIRKFREDPLTLVDLLNARVIDQKMAAYFWLMMENKATSLIVGSTGSGKTTLLNALLTLTRTNSKIVTIEEVQEVNIPHFNWTALLARENYGTTGETSSQVNLFDLVKAAMRMRPDIIVVGEVRGDEAYVLFQAISTGHGGMCSLHADDVESAIQRLTSKPMDVPPAFIPFLDLTFTVRRISVPNPGGGFRAVRRIVSVDEVTKVGEYFNVFRWNPSTDTFKASELRSSPKLTKLAKDQGVQLAGIIEELNKRAVVLRWLQERGIRNFREVSAVLEDYSARPAPVFQKAIKELGIAGTPEAVAAEGFRI